MELSIGSIHSSKLSFAASTVWPSTPAAERGLTIALLALAEIGGVTKLIEDELA
jgi:hypothetical protein